MIEPRSSDPRTVAVAVVGPLGLVALAYALWWVSDRLVYIGPLDRAAFGWIVIMPIWFISPAVAALLWRRLTERDTRIAVFATAAVISACAAWLLWVALDPWACETSPRTSAAELIGPSIFMGTLIGAGWAACGWLASGTAAAGRPKVAAAEAVALAIGHLFLVLGAFYFVILWFGGCNRPGTV